MEKDIPAVPWVAGRQIGGMETFLRDSSVAIIARHVIGSHGADESFTIFAVNTAHPFFIEVRQVLAK